jgi:hypothetical protein
VFRNDSARAIALVALTIGVASAQLTPITAPADTKTPGEKVERPEWAVSLDAALATAKKQHGLVFVVVSYDACGKCQTMDREVYPDRLRRP